MSMGGGVPRRPPVPRRIHEYEHSHDPPERQCARRRDVEQVEEQQRREDDRGAPHQVVNRRGAKPWLERRQSRIGVVAHGAFGMRSLVTRNLPSYPNTSPSQRCRTTSSIVISSAPTAVSVAMTSGVSHRGRVTRLLPLPNRIRSVAMRMVAGGSKATSQTTSMRSRGRSHSTTRPSAGSKLMVASKRRGRGKLNDRFHVWHERPVASR